MIIEGISDVGLIRENNQDSYFISKDSKFPLFILADGMGGHNAGDIASNMAVSTIKNLFLLNKENLSSEEEVINVIKTSIERANKKIYKKSLDTMEYTGMGTTVTLAYILNNIIYIGHVGDSRAYYISGDEIKQITEDHTLVHELIKEGEITKEQGEDHPRKNIITRAVGTNERIQIDIYKKEFRTNDQLLICSDGLTDMIRDNKILEIVNKNKNIMVQSKKMIEIANYKGGVDNITIILIKF